MRHRPSSHSISRLCPLIVAAALGLGGCGERDPDLEAREIQETTVGREIGAKPRVRLGPIADATTFRVTVRRSHGADVTGRYSIKCSDTVHGGIASFSGVSGNFGFKGRSPFTRDLDLYGGSGDGDEFEACGIVVEAELAKGRPGDIEMSVEAVLSDSAE